MIDKTNAPNISAAQVKELREQTGAAMMDCKKALVASGGDLKRAIEELRKAGITKAGKKADRIAAEGTIAIINEGKRAVMMEINCETDFVARGTDFVSFVKAVAEAALAAEEPFADQLLALTLAGHGNKTIEEVRQELVAKIGENVQIRRIVLSNPIAASVGAYLHGNRIGVLVELDVQNEDLARDIAMHIAASNPKVISPEHVSQEVVAKEKDIYMAQAASSGKPPAIIEKMVEGKLRKYLDEISLTGQPFVKDPDITVGNLLSKHRANILAFYRYEVGEGIEKNTEDFKETVMSQVQGS
jgi:elongation factor Ts